MDILKNVIASVNYKLAGMQYKNKKLYILHNPTQLQMEELLNPARDCAIPE